MNLVSMTVSLTMDEAKHLQTMVGDMTGKMLEDLKLSEDLNAALHDNLCVMTGWTDGE